MKFIKLSFLALAGLVLFAACKKDDEPEVTPSIYKTKLTFGPGEEAKIIEALLTLEDSTWVLLKAGNYSFENLSIVGVKTVKFSGEGIDKTILDFSEQTSGGEGILVTDVTNFVISDMKIMESEGDLLKIRSGQNVTIKNVSAFWGSFADSTNGGYGLYPVLCKTVLIDGCYAEGASDAGIYVGQSDDVIVKNSVARKNVAGCEIENTSNAVVYDNEFYENTGGFLIFDLPGLSKKGGNVKAYNNYIHDNNLKNFAPSSSFGTTTGVGNCPPGSGILHVSTSNVEIYNNRIINNNTASIYVVSGFILDENAASYIGENYYPFPTNVKIYDNEMSKSDVFPEAVSSHELGLQLVMMHLALKNADPDNHPSLQHIIIDGLNSNLITGESGINPDNLCIKETEANLFLNSDFLKAGQEGWAPSVDVTPYKVCP